MKLTAINDHVNNKARSVWMLKPNCAATITDNNPVNASMAG